MHHYTPAMQTIFDNLMDDQSRYDQIYARGAAYKFSASLDF